MSRSAATTRRGVLRKLREAEVELAKGLSLVTSAMDGRWQLLSDAGMAVAYSSSVRREARMTGSKCTDCVADRTLGMTPEPPAPKKGNTPSQAPINGSLLAISESATDLEIVSSDAGHDEYFIRVFGYRGATNAYTLDVAVSPAGATGPCPVRKLSSGDQQSLKQHGFYFQIGSIPCFRRKASNLRPISSQQ